MFARNGYENTTTRDIAKAARISNAALYYYFDSKEELLYQILEETMQDGLDRIEKIEGTPLSPLEMLTAVLKMHTASAVDFNRMKLLVHDQNSLTPEHRRALVQKQNAYVKKLCDLIDLLKEKGEVADLDTRACAFAFFGMASWAYRWYDPKGKVTPEELADIFHHIFTKGIFNK